MKNWTLFALGTLAAGAMMISSAACSATSSGAGTTAGKKKTGNTTVPAAADVKPKTPKPAAVPATTTKVMDPGVCTADLVNKCGCLPQADWYTDGTDVFDIACCDAVGDSLTLYACGDAYTCQDNGGGVGCVVTDATGAGGAGGSGAGGAAGAGGSGMTTDTTIIGAFEDPSAPACHDCLKNMTGTLKLVDGTMVDCGGVTAGCGAKDEQCGEAVTCIDAYVKAHPKDVLDCAVDKCIGMTSPPNDFFNCAAAKCGTECTLTVGFTNTAACGM